MEKTQPRGVLCRDGQPIEPCMLFAMQNHPNDTINSQQLLECYRFLRQNAIETGHPPVHRFPVREAPMHCFIN